MAAEFRSDVVPDSALSENDQPKRHAGCSALSAAQMLSAMKPEMIAALEEYEAKVTGEEPVEIPTEHVIHGGMYARTIAMPAGMVMTGVVMKRATLVIVTGSCAVLVGEDWMRLDGYNVLPGEAGRKAVFVSYTPVVITTVMPTQAKTVEEAEADMTEQTDRLLSHRQDANSVVITGD